MSTWITIFLANKTDLINHWNSGHDLPIPMTPTEDIDLSIFLMPAAKGKAKKPVEDNHLLIGLTSEF
jgi:hypothetical protein